MDGKKRRTSANSDESASAAKKAKNFKDFQNAIDQAPPKPIKPIEASAHQRFDFFSVRNFLQRLLFERPSVVASILLRALGIPRRDVMSIDGSRILKKVQFSASDNERLVALLEEMRPNPSVTSYIEKIKARSDSEQTIQKQILSEDIWWQIFSFLPKDCLNNVILTCKFWKKICLSYKRKLPAFEHLTLYNATEDKILKCIQSQRYSDLCALALFSPSISDESLALIPLCCPNLQMLTLRDCQTITDLGIQHLANLDHLNHLDISSCENLTNTAVEVFISGRSSRTLLEFLTEFDELITDEGVEVLITKCPRLQVLKISATSITDKTLDLMAQSSFPKVVELSLAGCLYITSKGLTRLLLGCPSIKHLDLSFLPEVQDSLLKIIAENCSQLKSLGIVNCPITDLGLQYLASGCVNLKALNLDFCEGITDSGIRALDSLTQLKKLSHRNCPGVSSSDFSYFTDAAALLSMRKSSKVIF